MEIRTQTVDTREEQRVVIHVAIVAVEPVPWGLRGARLWRPTSARMTYERDRYNGGEWSPWTTLATYVQGRNIRADGSDGADRLARLYGRPDPSDEDSALVDVWDGLAALRPTGDLPAAVEVTGRRANGEPRP